MENEINEINILYEKAINDLNKSFEKKYKNLKEEENKIKEKLENEVTKTKEKLENFLTEINNQINLNVKIDKGLKKMQNEEKNILKILSYISKISKSQKKMNNLLKQSCKSIKFKFNDEERNIKYKEFNFDESPDNNNYEISNLNSLIINDNKDYNKLLKNWINPNKKIKAELLYRYSRDGDQISKFHQLCDNKGPTLTLFYTNDENKGGIYTPLSWDTNTSGFKNDIESFMFNLNKNQKYKKLKKENSIWCGNDFGPWSYAFGFQSANQMKKIEHRGSCIDEYYEKGSQILSNNTNNYTYFNIIEVEVYKIIIS